VNISGFFFFNICDAEKEAKRNRTLKYPPDISASSKIHRISGSTFLWISQQRKVAKEIGSDILRIFQSHFPSGKWR
jgi:hypothetical protein